MVTAETAPKPVMMTVNMVCRMVNSVGLIPTCNRPKLGHAHRTEATANPNIVEQIAGHGDADHPQGIFFVAKKQITQRPLLHVARGACLDDLGLAHRQADPQRDRSYQGGNDKGNAPTPAIQCSVTSQ